ncbi:MAG: hypothetical protein CGW95_04125 [Phenylobacterium zucineum]|nr:MAG: hypothetical protein CGW95_04125 [Phenylobacterium zucineum]
MVKSYLHQEVATLLRDARNEIKTEVRDLQSQLEKAHGKIAALESSAVKATSRMDQAVEAADKALKAGQGAIALVSAHNTEIKAQRDKDTDFMRMLYNTMQEAGMPLPPEAATYFKTSNKRRSSDDEGLTMDITHE